MKNDLSFDVVVIGGGHAGCEAAAYQAQQHGTTTARKICGWSSAYVNQGWNAPAVEEITSVERKISDATK